MKHPSNVVTIASLQELDYWQGDDEDAMNAREGIPEPSRTDLRYYRCASSPKPSTFLAWSQHGSYPDVASTFETFEFEKQRFVMNTTRFDVWKCLRDGKLYF